MNFSGLKNMASEAGSGITKLQGLSLAYSDEVNSFFKNRFGFNLFDNNEERCKINDIELEWVQVTNDERNSTVKTHSLEDKDNTLISSNVSNGNRKYGINVILTEFDTKNAHEIYDEIVELWQNKTLCTISTIETIQDMIITKVSRSYVNESTFEFSLDFEVLEFAYLLREGEVKEDERTTLNREQKTGVAGTKDSRINKFKGFLEKADRLKNLDLEVLNETRNR